MAKKEDTMFAAIKAEFGAQLEIMDKKFRKLMDEFTVLGATVASLHQMIAAAVNQSAAAIQQNAFAMARMSDIEMGFEESRASPEPPPAQGHTAERHEAMNSPPGARYSEENPEPPPEKNVTSPEPPG